MTTAEVEFPQGLYRAPRRDPGTRRMVLVAGALLGAVALAGAGLWAFRARGPATVPVVEADPRPVRVKPENPGGLQIAGADDQILSGRSGPQVEGLTPAPEAPAALPARPQQPPAEAQVQQAALTPATGTSGAPAAPAAPPPVASPPAAPPPAASPPAAPPSAAPPAATAPPSRPEPAAASGATQVQLGALNSEEAARREWARLSRRLPDLFARRQPAITRLEQNGRTLYRLRTGGFADTPAAKAFCDQVRDKGGACLPVT